MEEARFAVTMRRFRKATFISLQDRARLNCVGKMLEWFAE